MGNTICGSRKAAADPGAPVCSGRGFTMIAHHFCAPAFSGNLPFKMMAQGLTVIASIL